MQLNNLDEANCGLNAMESLNQLKDWVTEKDATRYDGLAEGFCRLDITHSNLQQRWHDICLPIDNTVGAIKEKLYRHGGTPAGAQELYLRRGGGETMFLYDDSRTLRSYGAGNGMEIHIKDTDPYSLSRNGGLEDVSQVEKYVMDDDKYDQLKNTVRADKRREAEQRKAERAAAIARGEIPTPQGPARPETPRDVETKFPIDGRCEVAPGGRRGSVAYVGKVKGLQGTWIGIRLDEPLGQNDGTKDGSKYFDCGPKYGSFARPENVTVGDFPERDPFASEDEDEI